MLNKIKNGIALALHKEFGNGYEIYTEEVEQGLLKPCFSIVLINSDYKLELGKRYYMQNQFCIHYFPEKENKKEEMDNVLMRLYDCLEVIEIEKDSFIRGNGINGKSEDGVLHFFINFNLFVVKTGKKGEKMEEYSLDVRI